jgi:hypothetical protein
MIVSSDQYVDFALLNSGEELQSQAYAAELEYLEAHDKSTTISEITKTMRDKLGALAEEWFQLDEKILGKDRDVDWKPRPGSTRSGLGGRHLCIPSATSGHVLRNEAPSAQSMLSSETQSPSRVDEWMSLQHDDIPNDVRVEYLGCLREIILKVPNFIQTLGEAEAQEEESLQGRRAAAASTPVATALAVRTSTGDTNQQRKFENKYTTYHNDAALPRSQEPGQVYDGERIFLISLETMACLPSKQLRLKVLGSQSLKTLRDELYCNQDDPCLCEPTNGSIAKNASYFFIEGTFYVDTGSCTLAQAMAVLRPTLNWLDGWLEDGQVSLQRDHASLRCITSPPATTNSPSSAATAVPTEETAAAAAARQERSRARKEALGLPPDKPWGLLAMQDTLLRDLPPLRLGHSYLYCHAQFCEHGVVFDGLRPASLKPASSHRSSSDSLPPDPSRRERYPQRVWQCLFRRRRCDVCAIRNAHLVTYGDRLCPHFTTFFCELCFHALHYDEAGCLLYDDFESYTYLHDV